MKSVLATLCFTTILSFSACSKSPLHEPMEDMGDAFSTIRKADDLSTVTGEIDAFIQAAQTAKAQEIPEEHRTKFDKGIDKTIELANQLKSAVETGQLELAANTVKLLGENSKKYHDEFGVEH